MRGEDVYLKLFAFVCGMMACAVMSTLIIAVRPVQWYDVAIVLSTIYAGWNLFQSLRRLGA